MQFEDLNENRFICDNYETVLIEDFLSYRIANSYDVNIIHMNIRSIKKNFDEFIYYLNNCKTKFEIIILSETWISEDSEFVFNIEGYSVVNRNNRFTRSDGLCVFVRKDIDFQNIDVKLDNVNSIIIKFNFNNSFYQLMALYRSPSLEINAFLLSLDSYLQNISKDLSVIVMGDININIMDENHLNYLTNEYLSVLQLNGFKSYVNKYTRSVNNVNGQVNSCIDHIFFKSGSKKEEDVLGAILQSNITDHYSIVFHIRQKDHDSNSKTIPSKTVTRINFDKLKLELETQGWDDVCDNFTDDIDTLVDKFTFKINENINKFTETINYSHKNRPLKKWITPSLISAIRKRDTMHIKLKKQPFNIKLKQDYLNYRNILNSLIRKAKNDYYNNKFTEYKNNSKKRWECISELMGKERVYQEPKIDPKILNSYFVNVGAEHAKKLLDSVNYIEIPVPQSLNAPPVDSMFLNPTCVNEILEVIGELKNSASPGVDGISTHCVKLISEHIVLPLEHIINRCFSVGYFPRVFKSAKIIALHKSGDKANPENYRPISILNSFSKIMEKIMKRRILNYLDTNNFLEKNQFGFQHGKSTTEAIILLTRLIDENFNSKQKTLAVFLDLAKAFDTVPHSILLKKLDKCGIRGLCNDLLKSYLQDRKQTLNLNGTSVTDHSSSFGLPQGTVLSPVLFLIYLNDALKLTIPHCTQISFADDTALVFSGESWRQVYQFANEGLKIMKNWMDNHILTVNLKKTKYITFSPTLAGQPDDSLQLKMHTDPHCLNTGLNCLCQQIEKVNSIKYLGVVVDRYLKWDFHMNYLSSKLKFLVYSFYKINQLKDLDVKRSIYFAYAHSLFQYAIEAWGGAYDCHFNKIFTLQKHLIRAALGKPRRYPSKKLFEELNVPTLRQMYVTRVVLHLNKDRNNLEIRNIPYQTRSLALNNFNINLIKLVVCRHQFTYLCNIYSNKIPIKFINSKITKALIREINLWVGQNIYSTIPKC